MDDFQTRKTLVLERVGEISKIVKSKFGVDMSNTNVRFDLKGRVAGMAGFVGYKFGMGPETYLRFNVDMMMNGSWKSIFDEIIPHEIAHVVCFLKPSLGSNHDRGWKSVCVQLGGNGSRTHTEEVVYAKGNTYEYISTIGNPIRLSEIRHMNICKGMSYSLRTGGRVDKTCIFRIVSEKTGVDKSHSVPLNSNSPAGGPPRTTLVRIWIRQQVMNHDWSRNQCAEFCGEVFNMTKSQGKSYVLTQWDRALAER